MSGKAVDVITKGEIQLAIDVITKGAIQLDWFFDVIPGKTKVEIQIDWFNIEYQIKLKMFSPKGLFS